jgi:hypothetical protein
MTGLADIRTLSASGDRVVLSDAGATHPVFEGISSAQMSDWRTTYHAQWTQHATYPNDFTTLLTNADTNGNPGSLAVVVVRDECDWDGDGFDSNGDSCGGPDCDDRDPAISPAATEICDGIDNDCNEGVDEASAVGALRWYEDRDTDTWGNALVSITACTKPSGYVNRAGDCRDDIATANPDGTEVPYDGIDNDCVGGDRCDVDGDGANQDGPNCRGLDCNDSNPAIKPTAIEIWYDGIDQNCDDHNDWDADFDGFESEAETLDGTDCNDVDPTVYPGAPELADGKDNDCNGYREDVDTDGDGVFDEDEITAGTDPESADSDGDGVPDWYEIGGDLFNPLDTDNDGIIDARDGDDDGDGIPTSVEIGDWDWGVPGTLPPDADEDELPNHLDRDSDADSFPDEEEGVVDTDEDLIPDYLDTDSDDDTVLDIDERPGNTDGDAFDDRVDPDDDDDGLPTAVEAAWTEQDADNDTVPNWLDDDSDSDGIRDEIELDGDQDGDGIPNFVDADDFDGPLMQPERILQGGGCGGANTAPGAPTGAGLAAALLLLAQRRRR